MKTHAMAIFLAAWLLFLAAHNGLGPGSRPEYEEPVYQFEETTYSGGSETGSYSCRMLLLSVSNLERLSLEDAAMAERNMENFNGKMHSLMEAYTDRAAQIMDELTDSRGGPYYDEMSASCTITGQVVSVRVDNEGSYTGAAHPNRYAEGFLFDLGAGQFIDPSQLADDPQAFHDSAAELLVDKADNSFPERFWSNYRDIIRDSRGGVMLFDEDGMTVLYAPYELGPYIIGEVELRLDWEELAPLLGPGGLARLGVEILEK